MSFVHLHTHTQFSLLDGSNKIADYVKKCKDSGMTAAAITDHGVMYGVIEFYRACKDAGINPVIGCEVYVAPGNRADREASHGDDRYYHLILLAENNTGYANLMKIVSVGFTEGFYYKPRVDFETLEKYHEGLICLSACLAGELPRYILRDDYEGAKEFALKYRALFGKDNYFLEMQDHGIADQQKVNAALMKLSAETGIPLVTTNDCHYTNAEDATAHDVLLCIQTGKKISDEDRMRYEGGQFYVKTEEEMKRLFPYAIEACERTQEIADRCHVEIEFGVTKLPHFEVPEGYDSWTYLNKLCFDGLKRRYGDDAEKHVERLNYELETIRTMGYVDYFLIVWDFVNYARTHGVSVGPGRGSAAGSLVSYTTGITNVDPIRYSLIFERFLNPERVSMPDIDIDFDDAGRGKVIAYVNEKYGHECVTQIITFGALKARGVIRDVGRVMDLPYGFVDGIAKMVPMELNVTLKSAMEMNHELKEAYESDETVKTLIDTAMMLEGLPRNSGMHASGVVIASKSMDEYVPLSRGADGTIVTQFTKDPIEQLGLLKMDFLGLRNLSVLRDTLEQIKEHYGKEIDLDYIDFDDKAVYEYISSGKTDGVFQLESSGMKNFMKELRPESLEDVIAGISLYRPGPMDFIPAYIKGKNDKASVTYDCPQMEPILSPTYGCIVYQEQVMQIVRDLAGYSMGRSDLVRRAMAKKKASVMEQERKNFVYGNADEGVKGCVANGISEAVANKIFDEMMSFASYAFNKSHAACYAVVAYWTAYLKYYYPREYMAALMTSVMGETKKVASYIGECRSMGIEVLSPDVNSGAGAFSVQGDKIRYGMYALKSVGVPTVDAIVAEREAHGSYSSLEEFIERLGGEVNRRTLENLILSGAMDSLEGNRHQKNIMLPSLLESLASDRKKSTPGQMDLADFFSNGFGADSESESNGSEEQKALRMPLPPVEEYDTETVLSYEKELMGVYVSGHPLDAYRSLYEKSVNVHSSDFAMDEEKHEALIEDGKEVIAGGIIEDVNVKYTKTNKTMAFLTLEDLYGSIEVIVFPKDYESNRSQLVTGNKVFIQGRTSVEEDKDAKLICSQIKGFNECATEVWVQMADMATFEAREQELLSTVSEMKENGTAHLVVFIREGKKVKKYDNSYDILLSDDNVSAIKALFGEENVKVVEKSVEFSRKRY